MRLLLDYPWPGNVRELENSIEHAVTLSKSNTIYITDLPNQLLTGTGTQLQIKPQKKILKANEEQIIRTVLEECSGNKTAAAVTLGISRSTLYDKLKKFKILTS
jgi:two-component system response regulator HydG